MAWREPQGQLAGVADQAAGHGDEPTAQGGDHGFAAADAVTFHDGVVADGGGELVQPPCGARLLLARLAGWDDR